MRWKNALELFSTALMAVAAIVLLYRLLVPQEHAEWTETNVSIPVTELRNIQGAGQRIIVMFSDYECPFCASFHRASYASLEDKIIKPAVAQFAMVNMPLEKIHPLARGAAEAAECGAVQGRFWPLFDRLFLASPDLSVERIDQEAEAAQLDMGAFQRCRASGQAAAVDSDVRLAKLFKVTSTPSFFVGTSDGKQAVFDRYYVGAPRFEVLEREVTHQGVLARWWSAMSKR
jgi:protein-disulfide isomerase